MMGRFSSKLANEKVTSFSGSSALVPSRHPLHGTQKQKNKNYLPTQIRISDELLGLIGGVFRATAALETGGETS